MKSLPSYFASSSRPFASSRSQSHPALHGPRHGTSGGDDAVGVDDELFGGALVEVLIALGGVVEADDARVDVPGDRDLVVEDALHELAVVLHDRALAGGEGVALGPAESDADA